MKNAFRLLVATLLISGWLLAAASLHVIVAPGNAGSSAPRVVVLPKDRLGVGDTYVDTRGWSIDDVANHPAVAKRLLATGKADVLAHTVTGQGADVQAAINDALSRGAGPTTATTTTTTPRGATTGATSGPATQSDRSRNKRGSR
jgi:hypothetical protein